MGAGPWVCGAQQLSSLSRLAGLGICLGYQRTRLGLLYAPVGVESQNDRQNSRFGWIDLGLSRIVTDDGTWPVMLVRATAVVGASTATGRSQLM
ncbi:hypothetical protein V6N12_070602 [Hibiscus sabdariffa]|uniref:Uncharacterized protein n=1 Tax=Hibiscus sabdariffa TaxID=183260 RepID=A0ABR2FHB1_9ROSI